MSRLEKLLESGDIMLPEDLGDMATLAEIDYPFFEVMCERVFEQGDKVEVYGSRQGADFRLLNTLAYRGVEERSGTIAELLLGEEGYLVKPTNRVGYVKPKNPELDPVGICVAGNEKEEDYVFLK